jgi:lysozyme
MTEEGIGMVKRHEGLRLEAYRCPAGKLTIGYGHTAGVKEGDVISRERAEALLAGDIAVAEKDATALVGAAIFRSLTPARQDALTDMAFCLGRPVMATFEPTLNHIRRGQYNLAATHIMSSAWGKRQSNRAGEVARMLREG